MITYRHMKQHDMKIKKAKRKLFQLDMLVNCSSDLIENQLFVLLRYQADSNPSAGTSYKKRPFIIHNWYLARSWWTRYTRL